MEIINCDSYEELSSKAKDLFVDAVKKKIKEKVIVAIPGGRSVVGMFEKFDINDPDWSKVEIFMIDERMVGIDDKESNFRQAKELFWDRTGAKAHAFDIDKGIGGNNREIDEFTDNKRVFDIVILAAGEDGHVAGLFPDHDSVLHKGREYFTMDDSPKMPKDRMTASAEIIKGSDVIILLFASKAKKEAYDKFICDDISEDSCPAKICKQAKELYVLTSFT